MTQLLKILHLYKTAIWTTVSFLIESSHIYTTNGGWFKDETCHLQADNFNLAEYGSGAAMSVYIAYI